MLHVHLGRRDVRIHGPRSIRLERMRLRSHGLRPTGMCCRPEYIREGGIAPRIRCLCIRIWPVVSALLGAQVCHDRQKYLALARTGYVTQLVMSPFNEPNARTMTLNSQK